MLINRRELQKIVKQLLIYSFANNKMQLQVIHEPKITDHAWLKIVLYLNKIKSKYRKFNARDYSKFSIDEFISLMENRMGEGQDLEVNRREKKFIDSIVEALDIIAPKKNFRIPKVWEGKQMGFQMI